MQSWLVFVPVLAALTFDSDAWLERSAEMEEEAEGLRARFSNIVARVTTPAENLRIPIETFPDGRVKSIILAERGQFFLDDMTIWAKGVTVEQYKPDGALDLRLVADELVADRKAKNCWIEGHAKLTHKKTVLEGDGAFYSASNSFFKVLQRTHVVSEDVKFKGMKL